MAYTPKDLYNLLNDMQGKKDEKDTSQYRYVIYARKSTDNDERQIRSLGDQIIECQNLAESKKIPLPNIDVIEEKQSAKDSGLRPKFKKMLEDVKNGKYDGIIAWHPDRLARNMKEAGEIIDMIDREIIKDLQFVSFTFENSSSGKMLLGISFVLSKQYSDKLSDDVKRGIRRNIKEGKYLSKAKHGYYRDKNKMLRPDVKSDTYDKDNFSLMKKAWQMRLEGKTEQKIAEYLNDEKYERSEGYGKVTHKPLKMTKQILSEIFRDTFYAGVLAYGEDDKTFANLEDVYSDFVPMVSVDEFLKINRLSDITKAFSAKNRGLQESVKADFLRGIVICGHCGEGMSTSSPTKQTSKRKIHYYYFRCDTPDCKITLSNKKKVSQNVRGKVVLEYIYKFLEKNKIDYKKAYSSYLKEMKVVGENESKNLENTRKSIQEQLKNIEERIYQIKEFMLKEPDIEIKNSFKDDLKQKEKERNNFQKIIAEIKEAKEKGSKAILTYQEFVELFNDLPTILRKTKQIQDKDKIVKKMFLNFTLKDKKVLSYQLNQPFEGFYNKALVVSSRGERT